MMPRQPLRVLSLVLLVVPMVGTACAGHSYGHSRMTAMHPMNAWTRRGFAMRDPVARLLDHQGTLRLTPPQVNSLIAIDEKLETDIRPLRERLASLGPARHGRRRGKGDGAGADSANAGLRMARHDSAASVLQMIRENKWRATNAAYAQLTDEQMRIAARLEPAGRFGGRPGGRDGGPGPDGRRPRGMIGPPSEPPSGPDEG